ncbi:MAG TPA: hypothetical protein VEJ18_14445 [Planctomycetota bacterium]|nr:hypothetical protein [Planctomycetota bacterium]
MGLLEQLRRRHDPEAATLDEFFGRAGQEAWNRICDLARRNPQHVDAEALAFLAGRCAEAPGSFACLLIVVAAKDPARREEATRLLREQLPRFPARVLAAAGYNLHEFHRALDRTWIDDALRLMPHEPEGAWGVLEAAAMYEPHLLTAADVEAFDERRAAFPRDFFVSILSLAQHRPADAPALLDLVLRRFDEFPAPAVEAAAFVARDDAALQTTALVEAVERRFDANPEKAWEFFDGLSKTRPEIFDDARLDRLSARPGPGSFLAVLRRLERMERYVACVRRYPEAGIKHAAHAFHREEIRLVRPDLVRAICERFETDAYPAYDFLRRLVEERPELVGPKEIEDAIRAIPQATNWAFGFFSDLLKSRPEFTREATLALFECLALEPHHRAHVRSEELNGILAVSEAAHVKTGLEKALREPPRVGSRRARALMAMLFRQTLRARRHVLLEALRHAATCVLWRQRADRERFSPIWDFMMWVVDHAGDGAISTAAAEAFVEGAFQLNYLCRTGAEHEAFLRKLDLAEPPSTPFPDDVRFLSEDAELARLHDLVQELGRRFGAAPKLKAIDGYRGRVEAARRELSATEGKPGLEKRRANLAFRIAAWTGKDRSAQAQAFLRKDRRDLAKDLRDDLRAEAVRIAQAAIDASRMELYRGRVRDLLDRDVDLSAVDPKILPAFLWLQAVEGMPGNREGLKRLIEDRLEGRPHDWLRGEPRAAEWARRVAAANPEIRLERWRAPFTQDVQYRPTDAAAEKRRRIKADLAQARALLEKAGAKPATDRPDDLAEALAALRAPDPERKQEPDPELLQEVELNLERVRIAEATPESDFEGRIRFEVESDPFEILFMGEYGFASCLSLRGSNAWSAVSNAIDVDKTVVWAREPGGNVVGRRLLALMPEGIVQFRSYVNRNGLALDRAFDDFVKNYAAHCGTRVAHGLHPKPLLSDRWYDDGAI